MHGAVLGPEAFVLRYVGREFGDRLLLVNLGRDWDLRPATEPLLAPPLGMHWRLLFSSEEPQYGGAGTPVPDGKSWRLPGHAAIVLTSVEEGQRS
jgi:maltooligosyltrehalose trehalohydrolase